MALIYFKEAPKDISDLGGITGVEDEGNINLKNIDSISTAEKGISDSENSSISGEEKSKRTQNTNYIQL